MTHRIMIPKGCWELEYYSQDWLYCPHSILIISFCPLNIWKKIIKWALCTNRLMCWFSPISLLLLFTILLLSLLPFTVSHYCCMLLLIVGDDDDDYCCCYVGDVIIVVVIVIVVIIVALCVCNNCWPLSLKLWIDKVK